MPRTKQVPEPPPGSSYSRAQAQLVQDVLDTPPGMVPACLQVTHCNSQQEIRQKFRQVASRLHPDKNKAPHADEAFKRLNTACQDLLATR